MTGLLIFLASPSGGGKTTIIHELLKRFPDEFAYSVSSTTREPRPGEIDGRDYHFLSEEEFRRKIERGEFLEWEHVHDYLYGTDKLKIEELLAKGKKVLLDLDVKGTLNVSKKYPHQSITIFIVPPSKDELLNRLKKRGTDSEQEIERRLERYKMEMEYAKYFQHVVVNDDLSQAVNRVLQIIRDFEKKNKNRNRG